ncbi:hypothetical protein RRG08_060283 [Elysia crispata]|uniref:Secreted protein n=1 Tax=Elysia crispata TaxID=231223 RepID=A0AAE1DW46_9GAST|nr:hypothetical protein RRG08_060283 [Elysia crispata]
MVTWMAGGSIFWLMCLNVAQGPGVTVRSAKGWCRSEQVNYNKRIKPTRCLWENPAAKRERSLCGKLAVEFGGIDQRFGGAGDCTGDMLPDACHLIYNWLIIEHETRLEASSSHPFFSPISVNPVFVSCAPASHNGGGD